MIKSLPASGKAGLKHQHGLEQDTRDPGLLSIKSKKRKARREDENDGFVDSKSSRKILRIGQELAEEDQTYPSVVSSSAFALESRFPGLPGSQEEPLSDPDLDQEAWGDEEEEVEELVRAGNGIAIVRLTEIRRLILMTWTCSTNLCRRAMSLLWTSSKLLSQIPHTALGEILQISF